MFESALKKFALIALALFLISIGWQGVFGSAVAALIAPESLQASG